MWLGAVGRGADRVNLGYFPDDAHGGRDLAEWAAGRAAREFRRRLTPGRGVAEVVAELQRAGYVPACVRPPGQVTRRGRRAVPA